MWLLQISVLKNYRDVTNDAYSRPNRPDSYSPTAARTAQLRDSLYFRTYDANVVIYFLFRTVGTLK
jgi:hypothetical protein